MTQSWCGIPPCTSDRDFSNAASTSIGPRILENDGLSYNYPFTGTFITLDPATRLTLPTPWNIHSQWSLLLPYRHPPLRYRPALLADPWPKFRRRPCWRWNTKWPSWVVVHPVPVRQKSLPKKRISTLYFLKERWITQNHVEVRSHCAWLGNSIYQNRLWIERYACRHEEYSFRIHYRGCTDVSFLWWC